MPTMPPTYRPPGAWWPRQRKTEHDARRRKVKPWRKWYSLAVWKARRMRQLTDEPNCGRCCDFGIKEQATVANHKVPHRGDWYLFIGSELESLCGPCHDGEVQREKHAAMVAARRAGR